MNGDHEHCAGFVPVGQATRKFALSGGPCDGMPFAASTCVHGGWPDLVLFAKPADADSSGATPDTEAAAGAPSLSYRYDEAADTYVYIGRSA